MTKAWHLSFTAKGHTSAAKQSSHSTPTPRIGGLGLAAFAFVAILNGDTEISKISLFLCLSTLPVFLGGLGEDVGLNVTPRMRLFLSFISALVACLLLDAWIVRTGFPPLDLALSFSPLAIAFTVLVSGGMCHAINLVDGLNGLSLGISISIAAALAFISSIAGDPTMLTISLVLIGTLGGIFVFNFPFGKVFLGDAGAYTIGHLLTWFAILIIIRNPDVAPFSLFLVFFWPVADMLFSILRRIRNGKPIDQPDRMHFHQFVMRALELTIVSRRSISNPLASVTIWPLASIPVALAVIFHNFNLLAALAWIACFIVFVWTYVVGIRLARYLSRARNGDENLVQTVTREGFSKLRNAAGGSKIHPAE